jgi:hypothetical protein
MATRYRKVNFVGGRYVVELMKTDIEDLNLKVNDEIDIEDAVRKTSLSESVQEIFTKAMEKKK